MLVLSRRADESIVIQPADGVDATMTLAQLFANGPIQITLLGGTGRRVKMGIEAPEQLAIRRRFAIRRLRMIQVKGTDQALREAAKWFCER